MSRTLAALGALALSSAAGAECNTLQATFENEGTRVVLTTIAGEAGLRIANPEVITGKLDAVFEDEPPAQLFPRFAWLLGYELRIRGDEVWLHPADDARV
jgi:hypothetical protein